MLSPALVLSAYRQGVFPMALEDGRIAWFSPDPRGVILLERFHVPRRLARVVRSGRFEVRLDTAFEEVIRACASHPHTWISDEIIDAYVELHRQGHAHSVEAWLVRSPAPCLAGGLYGVALGGAFFGESMFHRVTDASKVALVALVDRLRARGYRLLDTQWLTPHLAQFGAIEISRRRYLRLLQESLAVDCRFA